MGSSDFGSLSVGPSQNHSQWSSRRRHRHRCATVPDSHRVHRDLIGAAPCTRRRLAPVHATRDVPFRQPLAVAPHQSLVAGASGTWNAPARGPGGAAGAVPRTPVAIRFEKPLRATPRGRHHDPQHICHGDERATPRIADKIHHAAPGTATGWPPPMRRGRSQEATTAKTVDAADERMRTRSRHRNVPRDGWYFAPPWYFGSTSRPVPHHVANPTIPNTSAMETNGPHLATDWISIPRRAPQLRKVVLPAPLHTWSTTLWLKNSSYQHKREGKYNFLDWFSSQNHREQPRRLHSDTQSEGASTIFRSKSCALPSRKGKCTQLSGVSEHALPDQELDEMDHKD